MDRALNKLGGPDRAAWVVFLLGAAIRIYNFTGMGLWIDEGSSILFMHQSWTQVLGLHGAYDSHPPLYWATAKLFSLVLPDLVAGRIVSVITGILTIPVVYYLARRVAGTQVALAAALALAVSPLHLWYSQEARMYVPSLLFVALSYLALVEYYYEPRRKWAIWYGVAVLLAMYFSYSSLYGLVPQALLFAVLIWKQKRRSLPLFVALGLAIVAYLPWVPQWLMSIQDADPFRVTYLGVEPRKVAFQMMEISGLAERGFFLSQPQLPWESARFLYRIFVAGAGLAGLVGTVVLFVRSKLGLSLALVVWLGTVVTAIVLSIVSPGFASRTTLYALVGWVILAGAATVRGKLPLWVNAIGWIGYATMICFSLVSIQQIYGAAFKQDWQSMATDVAAVAPRHDQFLIVRDVDETIIDYYFPGTLNSVMVTDTFFLPSDNDIVWFPYHDSPKFQVYHDQLNALGYVRIMHKYYYNPLYLDLYVKPGAHVGELSPANGQLAFTSADSKWLITPGPSADQSNTINGNGASLSAGAQAVTVIPAVPYDVYSLDEPRAASANGATRAVGLQCLSATNVALLQTVAPPGPQAAEPGPLEVAVLCPPGTVNLAITLANKADGTAQFAPVSLYETGALR
ncbi:MAG TPA: glycosyltransferase family 39 protein [Chloroflexia bacterium]|nr:glycosyltransferase family 39 protein [Chloroflexia bacterium]